MNTVAVEERSDSENIIDEGMYSAIFAHNNNHYYYQQKPEHNMIIPDREMNMKRQVIND